MKHVPSSLRSLEAALDVLEMGHLFLPKGDVFTGDGVEPYIAFKRSHEVDESRLRPHPYESFLYHDV